MRIKHKTHKECFQLKKIESVVVWYPPATRSSFGGNGKIGCGLHEIERRVVLTDLESNMIPTGETRKEI